MIARLARTMGLFGVLCTFASGCVGAQNSHRHAAPPLRDDVHAFVKSMAKKHAMDTENLSNLMHRAQSQQSILTAMSKPAEKKKAWFEYRAIFLTPERIKGGVSFWRANKTNLARAEKTYGVPPEIIVGIIGVETGYGKNTGKYRVLDALYTLCFDYPPRSKFFCGELEQFLLMTRETRQDPAALTGSYAGAMGLAQFMPSSFRRFAVDFDDDGHRNLWTNHGDAIGSVANYLKASGGWTEGTAIAVPATIAGNAYQQFVNRDLELNQTVASLKSAGVSTAVQLPGDSRARLLELRQADGPEHWLVLNNFYAITRYNHSALYAMAVFQLGESIRKRVEETTQ